MDGWKLQSVRGGIWKAVLLIKTCEFGGAEISGSVVINSLSSDLKWSWLLNSSLFSPW